MDLKIIELSERPEIIPTATEYFWKCWGTDKNFIFYEDCIKHSTTPKHALPKFYVGLLQNEIICSYALLVNDLISRQDLMPWFACLYVNEPHRGQGIAERLLDHGLAQAKEKGFEALYLSTDLKNFYERKNWTHIGDGYGWGGGSIKIYSRAT